MKRTLIIAAMLAMASVAAQAEPGKDSWGDAHVKEHFAGEFALGAVAGSAIENPYAAFGVAMVPGLVREEWKRRNGYDSYSPSRLIADALGAALGVAGGHIIIRPHFIGYKTQF